MQIGWRSLGPIRFSSTVSLSSQISPFLSFEKSAIAAYKRVAVPPAAVFISRMAVQAHQPGFGVLDGPSIFSSNAGGYENTRKRRGVEGVDVGSQIFMMGSQPSVPRPQKMTRMDHHTALVSTGLQLAFGGQSLGHLLSPSSSFCEDFGGSVVGQYSKELDLLLHAQGEQLRRALAGRQQAHYKQLLLAAEKSATQTLNKKQAELDRLVRRSAELENQLAQLQSDSLTWQSKAMASHATASSLHAQIQQVMAGAAASGSGESPADDAGSACVEPNRADEEGKLRCRACRKRTVSVLVLPCRHLCLCEDCDAAGVVKVCPVCDCVGCGSVRVFLC